MFDRFSVIEEHKNNRKSRQNDHHPHHTHSLSEWISVGCVTQAKYDYVHRFIDE